MSITPIVIRSGTSSMAKFRTFCSYGDTRCGKTHFAGTFPNALFISDASERGWVTLEHMNTEAFYHPDKGPVVLPVSDQTGMITALAIAEEWVRNGWISTVVIDSLTFYAESWYQHELEKMKKAPGSKGVDNRALYGAMANHLSNTRVQIHKWPCHVVWLALAAPPDELQQGGPMLSGKSRQRFPAGCDHIFYHRRWIAQDPETKADVPVFEVRTQAFERYVGGGRDGGLLPDPIPWPTFRTVSEYLGLPEWDPQTVPEAALDAAMKMIPGGHPPAPAPSQATPSNGTAAAPPPRAPARRPAVRAR